jgi:AcrR family transcriptional regulator
MLDVAERLLSTRSIDGVSLREIRLAAGQRNTSALQFHFGDREGLLRALQDRHGPRLQALLVEHYDEMIADGCEDDTRRLLGVFIRPTVDYVFMGSGERAWVIILAELIGRPDLLVHDFVNNSSPEAMDTGVRLLDALEPVMPRRLGFDRLFIVSDAVLHLCADRARAEDAPIPGRRQMDQDQFTQNIVDMAHAALFAPTRQNAR